MSQAFSQPESYSISNARAMPVLYLVFNDPRQGHTAVRVLDELTIGRALDNDLVTQDARVSKWHAQIQRRADRFYITDLSSMNGTWVNGRRIPASIPVQLHHHDSIGMGGFETRVIIAAPGQEPSPDELQAVAKGWPDPPTQILDISDIEEKLTPFQQNLLRRLVPPPDLKESLRRFAEEYLANPLEKIRAQNRAIRECLGIAEEQQIKPEDIPAELLTDAIVLNARIERLFFPEASDRDFINPNTYVELHNVEFLIHGDLFPSHMARLDEPETFDYRELLVGHKYRTDMLNLICDAKAVGVCHEPRIRRGQAREAAIEVFNLYLQLFSPLQESTVYAGELRTLGFFLREGGACRHRSAALQLMLQDAGIRSRYVRGQLMGDGQHAWVEVDEDDSGSYRLVLEPNFSIYGQKGTFEPLPGDKEKPRRGFFPLEQAISYGTNDPGSLGYIVTEGSFNTIWRPRKRTEMAVGPADQTMVF